MVRARLVVPVLLFTMALPMLAATKKRPARPPKDLQKVGDHWTAYNPPDVSTFPADSRVYTIVRGDTLWALAKKYYGNAYLWPQLWEANTYITDAHWIYPGDPLQVPGEPTTGELSSTETVTTDSTGETTAALTPLGTPIPLGSEADIFCFGYLGAVNENLPNRIVAFEDYELKSMALGQMSEDTGVSNDDIIYIQGGTSSGLVAGETYLVVDPAELVYHPAGKKAVVGRHYDFRGQVRILCATENQATAMVVQSCSDIHVGDALKPMPQLPIPLARVTPLPGVCAAPSNKVKGFIVNAKDYRFALGEGNVVQIDLGVDDFIEPGDFLTIYQENPMDGQPRIVLGEIGVLTAEAHTATARIIQMRKTITVGDRVELK